MRTITFTPGQEHALRALGWHDPLAPKAPNWFFEANSDADLLVLCDMTYRTLRDILGHRDRDVADVSFYEMVVALPETAQTEAKCA